MDRRSFLRRSLAAVGVLSLGRLPATTPAALIEPELVDGGTLELGVIRDSALVASGGLYAPVVPYYTLALLNSRRPIRDALPAFNADRGGIRYE